MGFFQVSPFELRRCAGALTVLAVAACGSNINVAGDNGSGGSSSGNGLVVTASSTTASSNTSVGSTSTGGTTTFSATSSSGTSGLVGTSASSAGSSGITASSGAASSGGSSTGSGDGGCSAKGGQVNVPCTVNNDCACGLQCFSGAFTTDRTCQLPCSKDLDCGTDAGQFCNVAAGYCQPNPVCNPFSGSSLFAACTANSDCLCPLDCLADEYGCGTSFCNQTCTKDSDCADAGTVCNVDAGVCHVVLPSSQCAANSSVVPYPYTGAMFTPCQTNVDCLCPLSCVNDPAIGAGNALSVCGGQVGVCELCDGGSCQSIGGNCVAPDPSGGLPPNTALPPLNCTSNDQCLCPNTCRFDQGNQSLLCAPLPAACSQSSACSDPSQFCSLGQCLTNLCPSQSAFGQPCSSEGAARQSDGGDGTCQFDPDFHATTLECILGGSVAVGDSCDPRATRSQSDRLCALGNACVPVGDGGQCAAICGYPNFTCQDSSQSCLTVPSWNFYPEEAVGSGGLCLSPNSAIQVPSDNCVQDSDCSSPLESCQGGTCSFNFSDCAVLGTACPADGGGGTCVYADIGYEVQPQLICQEAGTATSDCNPQADRLHPQDLCRVGSDCIPVGDAGICETLCDASKGVSGAQCGSGQYCSVVKPIYNLQVGAVPIGPNLIAEGSCLSSGDGDCATGHPFNEFSFCRTGADCACGLDCVADSTLPQAYETSVIGGFCERPCSASGDCAATYETCWSRLGGAGHCRINSCSGGLAYSTSSTNSATVGQICDADSQGSGTCLVGQDLFSEPLPTWLTYQQQTTFFSGTAIYDFGLCYQGGTATDSCDPRADRTHPELLCVPGSICSSAGTTPRCTPVCNTPQLLNDLDFYLENSVPVSCPSGQLCLLQECLPAVGVDGGKG